MRHVVQSKESAVVKNKHQRSACPFGKKGGKLKKDISVYKWRELQFECIVFCAAAISRVQLPALPLKATFMVAGGHNQNQS